MGQRGQILELTGKETSIEKKGKEAGKEERTGGKKTAIRREGSKRQAWIDRGDERSNSIMSLEFKGEKIHGEISQKKNGTNQESQIRISHGLHEQARKGGGGSNRKTKKETGAMDEVAAQYLGSIPI